MAQIKYMIREAAADDAESYNTFMRTIADEPHNQVSFHAGEYTATVEDTRKRLTNTEAHVNRKVFVAVDDQNNVIGQTSVSASDRIAARHSIGVGITVGAEYRGQGIGKALMQKVLDWATANPTIERIGLEVFTDNIPAINLYLNLGFVVEGTKRKAYRKHGKLKDSYLMAMLFERKE